MKDFRTFLLSRTGWQDGKGNIVVFSDRGLFVEPKGEELWLCLDEGLRCGGMNRKVDHTPEAVKEMLIGVGKNDLWKVIEADWNKEV